MKYNLNDMCNMNEFENVNDRVTEQSGNLYEYEEETKKLIQGLSRYKKSNVLLIGKAGVGKTALVENLARKINAGDVPNNLKSKQIFELSLNNSIAGTRYRGDFEEKIQYMLECMKDNKDNIIIFVDEIHNIMSFGRSRDNGTISLDEILKPFLARNDVTMIGATTIKEYNKYIKGNAAFDRRFCKLKVNEPKKSTVIEILKKSKSSYEKHYGIHLDDADLIRVVIKSKRRRGVFPDKAFDELEDYCYYLQKNKIDLNDLITSNKKRSDE